MSPATTKQRLRRYVPLLAITGGVVGVVAVIAWLLISAIGEPVKPTKKAIQQVQIIRPPPPPPKVEETPPEPELEEEVEIEEPEDVADVPDLDQPPLGDQLGLDAEGVAGGDAFGLLARRGGRDLLAGGGQDRFAWYAGILRSELGERLGEERKIRQSRYNVVVRLWIADDGRLERLELASSTGDRALDRDLVAALEAIPRISEAPPADLPQPVRLRIVSRI